MSRQMLHEQECAQRTTATSYTVQTVESPFKKRAKALYYHVIIKKKLNKQQLQMKKTTVQLTAVVQSQMTFYFVGKIQ